MARRRKNHSGGLKAALAVTSVVLMLALCLVSVYVFESRTGMEIEGAGQQMTSHTHSLHTAQIFMNGKWYAQRNMETLLIMGVDEYGQLRTSAGYNNDQQTDFLVLFTRDLDTGRTAAIHVNRDTMTQITMLGVTGEPAGTRYAQIALAYNYGSGDHTSSRNAADAVGHLLYGMEIDHYITVTMDAVPIVNDWAGGVMVTVADDFTSVDQTLVKGEMVTLRGDQALTYVRTRKELDDSSNLHRMERQRQYASEWVKTAQGKLNDMQAVADLVMQMDGYYRTSCTAEQLYDFAKSLGMHPSITTYEIPGEAVKGDMFMEYYVDEGALQQLVLDIFYVPVEG